MTRPLAYLHVAPTRSVNLHLWFALAGACIGLVLGLIQGAHL